MQFLSKMRPFSITIVLLGASLHIEAVLDKVKSREAEPLATDYFSVDFDQSMEFDRVDPFKKRNHPLVNLARNLYQNNQPTRQKKQEGTRIPKIIHLIWLGPKKPPAISEKCLKSIQKYLPDWEVILWRDADVPPLKLVNQKYYDEETNWAAKSDILRYELLYRFGGVYIDVDIEIVKSLDFFNEHYDFYAGLEASDNEAIVGNSIIASAPGHPILKDCIDMIKHHRVSMEDWRVVERTGPKHFQQSVLNGAGLCDNSRIMLFPKSFFYPISFDNRLSDENPIKPETCCVHYWAGSWTDNPR